jgi:hypothetical protein
MSAMQDKNHEFLNRIFQGDESAMVLVRHIYRLAHLIDDIVDRDRPVSDKEVYEAFWIALVQIPSNSFYCRYQKELVPVAATSILNWVAATDLEKRPSPTVDQLHVAHIIRCGVVDVLMLMATIIGGVKWGFEIAADLQMHCQDESFLTYLREHSQGHQGASNA